MPVLFAVTLFVSASLLFMVQPMVGRMILPLLGGSPAAWNTCMVFFQMMLLLGYLYAHKVTTRFGPKQQVWLHIGVLAVATAALGVAAVFSDRHSPIAVVKSLAPQGTAYPMFGVLALLFVAIGVPFVAVSASAPLLQRWFAYTGHPASKDPYFLYAASNAGSLLSLLGYPLVTEPSLRLVEQAWVWAVGFVILAAMIFVCGSKVSAAAKVIETAPADDGPPPTLARKLKWLALAFVPSSLMLGVTTHMTTDIASVPLLWVGPLALYLVTFIIAFARLPKWFRPVLGNLSPVVTLLLVFLLTSDTSLSTFWMLGLHLLAYFLAALMCHTELAFDRPPTAYLTNFFLIMSIGGMFGGVFNALLAPIVFPLAYEYPIAIALGCMLVPNLSRGERKLGTEGASGLLGLYGLGAACGSLLTSSGDAILTTFLPEETRHRLGLVVPEDPPERAAVERTVLSRVLDFVIPVGMGLCVFGLLQLSGWQPFNTACSWIAEKATTGLQFCGLKVELGAGKIRDLTLYALPAMACFFFIDRPLRFGLCVAAFLGVSYAAQSRNNIVHTERSYFGVLKVMEYGDYKTRLIHGTTLHGIQNKQPGYYGLRYPNEGYKDVLEAVVGAGMFRGVSIREEPLTYYHRTGPVGHMFVVTKEKHPTFTYAMVGLGTGSAACYAEKGQTMTFYEIDPAVKALVADTPEYFTYVTDARNRGATVNITLGDARLKLEEDVDKKYQLLMVDAFSSDSIPVHLLTKEAVELYLNRVPEDGIVALHISNKYVKLDLVAARICEDLHVSALVLNDGWNDRDEERLKAEIGYDVPAGKTQSSWVVVARDAKTLEPFKRESFTTPFGVKWKELPLDPAVRTWTDDYSDVLSVMMIPQLQKMRQMLGLPTAKSLVDD